MRPNSSFDGTMTLQDKLEALVISLVQAGMLNIKKNDELNERRAVKNFTPPST